MQQRMREAQFGSHTIQSHGVTLARTHIHDWFILILLIAIMILLNMIHPFYRFVGKDMMSDLKYPLKSNTVPVWAVPVSVFLASLILLPNIDAFTRIISCQFSYYFFCLTRCMLSCCQWSFLLLSIFVGEMFMIFIMQY